MLVPLRVPEGATPNARLGFEVRPAPLPPMDALAVDAARAAAAASDPFASIEVQEVSRRHQTALLYRGPWTLGPWADARPISEANTSDASAAPRLHQRRYEVTVPAERPPFGMMPVRVSGRRCVLTLPEAAHPAEMVECMPAWGVDEE